MAEKSFVFFFMKYVFSLKPFHPTTENRGKGLKRKKTHRLNTKKNLFFAPLYGCSKLFNQSNLKFPADREHIVYYIKLLELCSFFTLNNMV